MEIGDKLAAARVRLILDRPFLGALALRLPMVPASWCKTTATDARRFYYNPAYLEDLDIEQLQFVIAHEAMHCALSHFSRRGGRVKSRWDIACDHAVNPLLLAEGLSPPPGTIILTCFDGMTAEEIYPLINEEGESMDEHLYDGDGQGAEGGSSGGKPSPLSAKEKEALTDVWKQYVAQAMQQAKEAGKLGGLAARMAGELLKSKLPWRMLLARHLSQLAREDYSYHRPSRREGAMILPSLRSAEADLVIALDVSGSVSKDEMDAFLSEIKGIKGQLRARVTLLACDSSLSGPWAYEPWEDFCLPESFKGGGGTDFRPVFEWVSKQDRPPALLVYFTDALGEFPQDEPSHPVLWLVKGKAEVPWGERIQLN